MSYTPTAGIITAIEYQGDGAFGGSDCTLLLTVQSEDQGLVHILLPPGAYRLILATYSATTRSFPAQTVPEQMVVFCSSSV